jgi:hypothetical protein
MDFSRGLGCAAGAMVLLVGCLGEGSQSRTPASTVYSEVDQPPIVDPQAQPQGQGRSQRHELRASNEEGGPQARLSSAECKNAPAGTTAPFDHNAGDGAIKAGAERAWACGLHTTTAMNLKLVVTWAPAGCVSEVAIENEIPSSIGECLIRRFGLSSVPAFQGAPVSVRVRMIDDRAYFEW